MAKPVTIGKLDFKTKTAAREYYTKILHDTDLGEYLEGDDYDSVMALLRNHPHADKKIGFGVAAIKVAKAFIPTNRCFYVVRTDETVDDFSIGKCIDVASKVGRTL